MPEGCAVPPSVMASWWTRSQSRRAIGNDIANTPSWALDRARALELDQLRRKKVSLYITALEKT